MLQDGLTRTLLETLDRPDLRTIAGPVDVSLDVHLAIPFRVCGPRVVLGGLALERPELSPTLLRHALELARLRLDAPDIGCEYAIFASARLAALFHDLTPEACSTTDILPWIDVLRQDHVPPVQVLHTLWSQLSRMVADAPEQIDGEAAARGLERVWPMLGPTEALMAEGGDARLAVDPDTGLNRYGCSHRPRPWAVTFASSTASSLSERGFEGAENARRRAVVAILRGHNVDQAREASSHDARIALARCYGVMPEQVILAASGTDCELAVLAIAADRANARPLSNILVAPDETGSGVPLAAAGRHFADEAANDAIVTKGARVEGFPDATILHGVAIRDGAGSPRESAEIDAECEATIAREISAGRHVILHQLDMSKTGLVAPREDLLETLLARFDGRLDIVVDACQARLEPARIRQMVAAGIMVMVTGSKFFTGPPFCGALLLPQAHVARLSKARLPRGLSAYAHKAEWPPLLEDNALRDGANFGLALRWHAALAEMLAFLAIPPDRIRATLVAFLEMGRDAIDANPDLELLEPPALIRPPIEGRPGWDDVPTILSFLVRDPQDHERVMVLEDTRRLHRWLNADLSPWIRNSPIASRLCHLGQPVPVNAPQLGDATLAGALRLCAGARLVSGEPSHAGMDPSARLIREFNDARAALAKISLILQNWDSLRAADPVPHYAPLQMDRQGTS